MMLKRQDGSLFRSKAVTATILIGIYLLGALSHSRDFWPIRFLRHVRTSLEAYATADSQSLTQFDSVNRLTYYADKHQVSCPLRGKDTGVLLVIGQSNVANQAQRRFTTQYPTNVVNYFSGRCYVASSPLLGATGHDGEFLTPLADELIASGTYKNVVIVAAAVGGSPVARWGRYGDLNESLISLVKEVQNNFAITEVIWHQGETDAVPFYGTSTKLYVTAFRSLLATLREAGLKAPVFVSIATRWCNAGDDWKETNYVATAQRMLIDNKTIFFGVNTDELVELKDRYDTCHFAESGQIKTAKAFADSIRAVKTQTLRPDRSRHPASSRVSHPL